MSEKRGPKEYLTNLAIGALIRLALALPYGARVRVMGWLASAVIAPLAGWRTRIRNNLAHVMPDLPAPEVARLVRAVPNNIGRSLIESYSGAAFLERTRGLPLTGPGAEALRRIHAAGRPAILVTAHFGNYQALRAALGAKGIEMGVVYKPMSNGYFNDRYVAEIEALGGPVNFPRSRRGLAEMVKHLRQGGMVGIVTDHYVARGTPIPFLGQPASTALSTAELALKYDAAVIPIYSRRLEDGLGFEIFVDREIPHTTPLEMTQAMVASLEPLVRAHPEQWFWIHRRWKAPGGAHPPEA